MVEAAYIEDRASLEAWLDERPESGRQCEAGIIAQRAAMRGMPVYAVWLAKSHKDGLTVLPVLRCNLVASVAAVSPADDIREAASAAATASGSATIASVTAPDLASGPGSVASAAYAAESASDAAAYAASVSASDNAAYAAAAAASASCMAAPAPLATSFQAVQLDALALDAEKDPFSLPLWHAVEPEGSSESWEKARQWMTDTRGYGFWVRWYEAALAGNPVAADWDSHWALLRDISKRVTPQDWERGVAHVAGIIDELEENYTQKVSHQSLRDAETLLCSALGRFGFNDLRNLMEMLPFSDDLKSLKDVNAIDAFVADMNQQRREIDVFMKAIEAEGRRLQGAGSIRIYLGEILEEASKARQLSELNIGWIVDCGEILQGYSSSRETLDELGPLMIPFRRTLQNLLNLTHRHFSTTILRMSALKDIRSSNETDLRSLMQALQGGFEKIKSDASSDRVPMAPEALAVFEKLLEESNRLIQRELLADDPVFKSELRKEIDYRMAQVSVSLRLYLEQARNPGKAVGEVVKGVAKKKTTQGVEGLVEWVIDFLKTGS
ncbi:hypothetical protein K3553_11360 [Leisingera aquaemixtae]|uniref:hypothetical protein n=1 Tax=Leisingera aquaemixtae TaxID=1396826 RepID=UPI0021A5B995|nr:hypothetical protein [Leisingera aquaemixtae]UWQ23583.1 hypothetical protein K3553_11360 [Leisingera aquaemixtae]UWQ36114.1 hypothetical protein K3552_11320 [Leisingera aquaemixtae]UWQ44474.1 hypothetical protein K3719_11755 [Leisingera aquaemixtae]